MKIRHFGFAVLTTLNIYITYSIWDTLFISKINQDVAGSSSVRE